MHITITCLMIVSFLVSSVCPKSNGIFHHGKDIISHIRQLVNDRNTDTNFRADEEEYITATNFSIQQFFLIGSDRQWEDLVLGGPTAVNFLGLLMVSASQRDIALTPRSGYTVQFIQNINSLHATLSQVSKAIQMAFLGAHEDLIRTQISMGQIPEHMKASLLLIKTSPDDLRKKLIPYTLRNIDRAATEGSAVSKPTLSRFSQVGKLIDEVVLVLSSTISSLLSNIENYNFVSEVEVHAVDLQVQWYLLIELFIKFSDTTDIIREKTTKTFVDPIQKAQDGNNFNIEADRAAHLRTLIPATIVIDQSTNLLQMMVYTYTNVSNEHMVTQIAQIGSFLSLTTNSTRITSQRDLWQRMIAQSVKVARLAQIRQNEFMDGRNDRQKEYNEFLLSTVVTT